MLNNLAKTPIGHLDFDEKRINKFFEVDDIVLTSTGLQKHLPIFEKKLGKDKPIKIKVSYKDIDAKVGQPDVDINIDYTLCI